MTVGLLYRNYPHLVCSPPLSVIFFLHESAIILLYYVKRIKHTIFDHHSSVHCGEALVVGHFGTYPLLPLKIEASYLVFFMHRTRQ